MGSMWRSRSARDGWPSSAEIAPWSCTGSTNRREAVAGGRACQPGQRGLERICTSRYGNSTAMVDGPAIAGRDGWRQKIAPHDRGVLMAESYMIQACPSATESYRPLWPGCPSLRRRTDATRSHGLGRVDGASVRDPGTEDDRPIHKPADPTAGLQQERYRVGDQCRAEVAEWQTQLT